MSVGFRAVAIDGPAASGKSTVARRLAGELGLVMVNSGAMYRAVTWQLLEDGVAVDDAEAVVAGLGKMEIVCGEVDGGSTIEVNGRILGSELRSERVNGSVSKVAAVPEVRERLVALQRGYLESRDVVMEGRDIGSVVFPDTRFKFYVDASEEVRRARRAADGEVDGVAERDAQDSQRKTAPLKVADGAVVIDSSELTVDEVVGLVKGKMVELGWEVGE